jgi:tripartite-type tricarboxylate transporter receptor subunit TctC
MQTKNRTRVGFIFSIALVCLLGVGSLQAQDYPKGPVQIVIPFGTGGSTDIFWRSVSEFLAGNVKGTIALVNKPGGGGVAGTSFVVNSKPDGYTLVSANSDPISMSPVFTPGVPYDPEKDLTYIAKLVVSPSIIAVRADSPFKAIGDVVDFAKANPKKLKCGVMAAGSVPHTIIEVFNRDAKIDIIPIPFDGGGEIMTNLLGGHTDLCVASVSTLKSQVQAGKIRVLAVCSPKRLSDFPDAPNIGEKGYKKSSIATGVGLAGPNGLPPAIVSRWTEAVDKTLKDPKAIAMIEKLGGLVIDFKTGEEYKKELMADVALFKEIAPTVPSKK